jgi:hypothetical protein
MLSSIIRNSALSKVHNIRLDLMPIISITRISLDQSIARMFNFRNFLQDRKVYLNSTEIFNMAYLNYGNYFYKFLYFKKTVIYYPDYISRYAEFYDHLSSFLPQYHYKGFFFNNKNLSYCLGTKTVDIMGVPFFTLLITKCEIQL